ncbi:MAG: Uma2 family endonuclease [Pyrinomonadaceae bacterium]
MVLAHKVPLVRVEEYLELEKDGTVRHEYVDGRVFAVPGASLRHGLIVGNILQRLGEKLRGTKCTVFITDAKVKASSTAYYYPDLVVTCSPIPQTEYVCPDPILVVEVLSPTTEQIDRREKLLAYQRIDSVKEYLLVAQDQMLIEIYRRQDDGVWEHEKFNQAGDLSLISVGVDLPVDEIYRGVSFEV